MDVGIHCTFNLSCGDRPSDSAGGDADLTCLGHLLINGEKYVMVLLPPLYVVFLRRDALLISFFFCLLGASSPLSSVDLVWKKKLRGELRMEYKSKRTKQAIILLEIKLLT
ncbi:hypothetical protein OIU85_014203 [Salix viminalis]|uniref:Uncharacterized protein n=1 Tax=Salix viminalis TaxID=40686 RepID=A0A9Q0SDL6_SALVM|nr:hypothetical protein OIU85_014203 [Salix viminalis]